MKISRQMILSLTRYIFGPYEDCYENSPNSPAGYREDIENMRKTAAFFGDLDALDLALGYIVNNPEIDVSNFVESIMQFDNDEVRQVLEYAWNILPQGNRTKIEEKIPFVEISDIPL